ncbi:MurR/RpiR family transcriptional regulator [Nitrincola sp. MINF-07-Sa-05]|uniref:MurR/RpiR family transcriptional regulator n=1 Tax=Nitrincola salilacus TaxID=3400273 RepID=UPI00391802E4
MRQITELIRQHYEHLSPSERRVAGFILDHLDDLATYNSVELSEQCNTSKATVSRLFRRLGYNSFKDMREEVRKLRQSGVPLPGNVGQQGVGLIERHLKSEADNLQRLSVLFQNAQLQGFIAALADARQVGVIGFRNSYPVAMHLRQQLIQVRPQVALLPQPGQTLAEELVGYTPQDMIILAGFHRRPRAFSHIIAGIREQQVPLALLTETGSGLADCHPDWLFEIPLDSISAFDSYALPMSLVSLISNLLLHHQLSQGRLRIEQINALYEVTQELDLNL